MGRTIETLTEKQIEQRSIFNNRFVIEICEKVHTHYRNLRIVQTLDDFITMADGFNQALERWKKRGCPGCGEGVHIELCRKKIAVADESDKIAINLNENLYLQNEGKIFSEGANFTEGSYIHLKYRDLRLEMGLDEFRDFSDAVIEAKKRLEDSSISQSLR